MAVEECDATEAQTKLLKLGTKEKNTYHLL